MINKCHQYKKREGRDFFVCILFLLFFIIHTKLQKSIELQVLEVHDTYLILQDLKYSNDYRGRFGWKRIYGF